MTVRYIDEPAALPRTLRLVDDRDENCVVPGCIVRSRNLCVHRICPPHLWDERHEAHAARWRSSLCLHGGAVDVAGDRTRRRIPA